MKRILSNKALRLSRTAMLFGMVACLVFAGALQNTVYADDCPKGLSAFDCQAILNGWVDWVPDTCSSGGSATILVGKDNIEKAFNYFLSKGLSSVQAAAIVGNFDHESGVNPKAVESDSGNPGVGHGIAQWSIGARWDGKDKSGNYLPDTLYGFPGRDDRDVYDLATQLDFSWYELTGPYKAALTDLQHYTSESDISKATMDFNNLYEQSSDKPGSAQMQDRIKDATDIWHSYSDSIAPLSGCSVVCTSGTSATPAEISTVRQSAVCIARQELAAWGQYTKQPPPYLQFLKYTNNNYGPWCADFVSWIYKQAGYPFAGVVDGWRDPGVPDIVALGKKETTFHWHPFGGYTPRPGDIVIANNDGNRNHYDHTALVVDVANSKVIWIGGDQDSSDGQWGTAKNSAVVDEWTKSITSSSIDGYVSPD